MKCPLCNKDRRRIITDSLRHGEKRKVYYCGSCQMAMLDDNRSEKDIKKFYEKEYRKKFKPKLNQPVIPKELFDIYSNFQGGRIKLIKGFLNRKMRLLEIGCSAGMFLFHIKDYVREVVGIDFDSKAADFTSEKCSSRVFDTDIEDADLNEEYFDIICMFQLLEHVKNPYEFLKRHAKYLKPNGIIYVEVPNLRDALIYAYNCPNHYRFYFHPAHLWYFTAKSLGLLMKKAGFDGRIYFTQDYNILNHMHWLSVDAPQADCIKGLSSPCLPLRDSLEWNKKQRLNNFIQRMDFQYKEMLKELGLTSNLSFIGRKRK